MNYACLLAARLFSLFFSPELLSDAVCSGEPRAIAVCSLLSHLVLLLFYLCVLENTSHVLLAGEALVTCGEWGIFSYMCMTWFPCFLSIFPMGTYGLKPGPGVKDRGLGIGTCAWLLCLALRSFC